jgi:hypothetical protein
MPTRFKKIDKVFEKIIGKSEIESISSTENENENENDIIENDTVYLYEDSELNNCSHNSDYILERMYNIFSYLQNIFNFIFGVSSIYLLWICLHYFA